MCLRECPSSWNLTDKAPGCTSKETHVAEINKATGRRGCTGLSQNSAQLSLMGVSWVFTRPNQMIVEACRLYSGVVSIMHQKFVESGSPGLCSKPPWNLSLHLGMWMYLRKLVCMCVRLCDIHIKVHSSTLAKLIPNRFTVTCFNTVQPLQGPSRVYPHPRTEAMAGPGLEPPQLASKDEVSCMECWPDFNDFNDSKI